jgi:hypothetical protein
MARSAANRPNQFFEEQISEVCAVAIFRTATNSWAESIILHGRLQFAWQLKKFFEGFPAFCEGINFADKKHGSKIKARNKIE